MVVLPRNDLVSSLVHPQPKIELIQHPQFRQLVERVVNGGRGYVWKLTSGTPQDLLCRHVRPIVQQDSDDNSPLGRDTTPFGPQLGTNPI